jgi:hypothetical protein
MASPWIPAPQLMSSVNYMSHYPRKKSKDERIHSSTKKHERISSTKKSHMLTYIQSHVKHTDTHS